MLERRCARRKKEILMTILGKGEGIFKLNDSDKTVGSYLIKEDIAQLLSIEISDLSSVKFETINGFDVIDEIKLMKLWYDNKIPNAIPPAKTSLDELILKSLIKIAYPNSTIFTQEKIGRYSMDFKISVNGITKYIEFDGPHHFSITRYGPPKKHPFEKKKTVEDKTGIEVINWPYWIQRCTSNIKAIFENDKNGLGALWSTNVHFGDFVFEDSANIIKDMCLRFGAWGLTGACDFYEENSKNRIKPEHPIIEKIKLGKESRGRLIPKGSSELELWIPEKIRR